MNNLPKPNSSPRTLAPRIANTADSFDQGKESPASSDARDSARPKLGDKILKINVPSNPSDAKMTKVQRRTSNIYQSPFSLDDSLSSSESTISIDQTSLEKSQTQDPTGYTGEDHVPVNKQSRLWMLNSYSLSQKIPNEEKTQMMPDEKEESKINQPSEKVPKLTIWEFDKKPSNPLPASNYPRAGLTRNPRSPEIPKTPPSISSEFKSNPAQNSKQSEIEPRKLHKENTINTSKKKVTSKFKGLLNFNSKPKKHQTEVEKARALFSMVNKKEINSSITIENEKIFDKTESEYKATFPEFMNLGVAEYAQVRARLQLACEPISGNLVQKLSTLGAQRMFQELIILNIFSANAPYADASLSLEQLTIIAKTVNYQFSKVIRNANLLDRETRRFEKKSIDGILDFDKAQTKSRLAEIENDLAFSKKRLELCIKKCAARMLQPEILKRKSTSVQNELANDLRKALNFDPASLPIFWRANTPALAAFANLYIPITEPLFQPIAEQLLLKMRTHDLKSLNEEGQMNGGVPVRIDENGETVCRSSMTWINFMSKALEETVEQTIKIDLPREIKKCITNLYGIVNAETKNQEALVPANTEQIQAFSSSIKLTILQAVYLRTVTPIISDLLSDLGMRRGEARDAVLFIQGMLQRIVNLSKLQKTVIPIEIESKINELSKKMTAHLNKLVIDLDFQ